MHLFVLPPRKWTKSYLCSPHSNFRTPIQNITWLDDLKKCIRHCARHICIVSKIKIKTKWNFVIRKNSGTVIWRTTILIVLAWLCIRKKSAKMTRLLGSNIQKSIPKTETCKILYFNFYKWPWWSFSACRQIYGGGEGQNENKY